MSKNNNKVMIVFEKMHGLGNDFVLIDNRHQNFKPSAYLIVSLANRNTGIGFDQLLLLENSGENDCDACYRFFNPDGSEAEQCGNGQRCIAKFLHNLNPEKTEFCVNGLAGKIYSTIHDSGLVTVNMGKAKSIIPAQHDHEKGYQVDFGNPHFVLEKKNIEDVNLNALNKEVIKNYPSGVNIEIVEILSTGSMKIRVYERGTGETLACGSGACASALAMMSENKVSNKVKVMLLGGELVVEYSDDGDTLLTGEAVSVFRGEIQI